MVLTASQRDTIIRTIAGEAANQGTVGQTAVAWNIRNRSNDPRWPSDPASVARQPSQYSAWNSRARGGNRIPRSISANSPLYQQIGDIVDGVWGGTIPDPTNGAVYYGNVPNARAGWGAFLNAQGNVSQIGDHTFAGSADVASTPPIPRLRPAATMDQRFADAFGGTADTSSPLAQALAANTTPAPNIFDQYGIAFAGQPQATPAASATDAMATGANIPQASRDSSLWDALTPSQQASAVSNAALQRAYDMGFGFDRMAALAPGIDASAREQAGAPPASGVAPDYLARAQANLRAAQSAPASASIDPIDLMTLAVPSQQRPAYSNPIAGADIGRMAGSSVNTPNPSTSGENLFTAYARSGRAPSNIIMADLSAAPRTTSVAVAAPSGGFEPPATGTGNTFIPAMADQSILADLQGMPTTGATAPTIDVQPAAPDVPEAQPTAVAAARTGTLGKVLKNPLARGALGYALGGPLGTLLGAGSALVNQNGGLGALLGNLGNAVAMGAQSFANGVTTSGGSRGRDSYTISPSSVSFDGRNYNPIAGSTIISPTGTIMSPSEYVNSFRY